MIAEGSKDEVINIKDETTYQTIRAISEQREKIEDENGNILSL